MKWKRWAAAGLALALVVTLTVVLVPRTDWWHCRFGGGLTEPDPLGFHTAGQLDIPDTYDAIVDELRAAGFGDLIGGVTDRGVGVVLDQDQILLTGSNEQPLEWPRFTGTWTVLEPESGESWSRRVTGARASVGFSGEFMMAGAIESDRLPLVTAYDRERGRVQSCSWLGDRDDVDGRMVAGVIEEGEYAGQQVVSHPTPDDSEGYALTRIDPASGDQHWTAETSLVDVKGVDVTGSVAIGGRFSEFDVGASGTANTFHMDAERVVSIEALDLASGELLWQWPEQIPTTPTIAAVLGTVPHDDAGDGLVLASVLEEHDAEHAERRIIALDAVTGEEVWSHDVAYAGNATLHNGLLVFNGGDDWKGLVALDARTGVLQWEESPGDDGPEFDASTAEALHDDSLLVLDSDRVPWALNLVTGDAERYDVEERRIGSVQLSESLAVVRVETPNESDVDPVTLVFARS
ncbi:PQQ-binding-like beta-propeller repeat protein [uncultured Agrococcus sp.]|uniref:outer membrane protein assembly factor BamB family protein n=1 Tax=uncultured Agrococcus sp. TaxID=382258 RepID=UPI0025F52A36|nr:PQQ-binding-like beta-propeller repeat protein [uncultured Agrococcus sp.]